MRVGSFATPFDVGGVPRPVLVLVVSSVGTLVGLGIFMLLSARLLGPSAAEGFGRVALAGARYRLAGARSRPSADSDAPAVAVTAESATVAPPADVVGPVWGGSIRSEGLRFTVPPSPGTDRCRIVSRLVPLRSEPDEFCRTYVGRLDIGDEVDVVRQEGPFCLVRTPSGAEGWVPGLTLTGSSGTRPEVADHER